MCCSRVIKLLVVFFLLGAALAAFAVLNPGLFGSFKLIEEFTPAVADKQLAAGFKVSESPVPVGSGVRSKADRQENPRGDVPAAIVKDISEPTKVDCVGSIFEQLQCYRAYYQKLVKDDGAKRAMADIRSRYDDPFIHSQCHQLAHVVGREAALFYRNLSLSFQLGDSFCWSGYYHGVMEGVVGEIGKSKLVDKLDSICQEIPGKEKYSFDYYNCVHGLGHGVMSILQNELPESLKMCDNLTGSWERSSCWSGAFMENIIADEVYHFAKYLKADDPLYPCNMVEAQYKNTCYLMQTSRMLALVNRDFAKVFELCSGVEEPYSAVCYQSLGRDASGNTISNVDLTRGYCMLGRDFVQKSNCIIGAVKDFISFHHSDIEAKKLCGSFPEDLQPVCFSTAEGYYTLF